MRATLRHEAGGRCFGVRLRPLHRQPALHDVDPATKAFAVNIRYGRSLAPTARRRRSVCCCAPTATARWSPGCAAPLPRGRGTRP